MAEETMRPYVQIAAICQTMLQENQGFISVIRLMDRIPVNGMTDAMQPQPLHSLSLVVVLKSGSMVGNFKVRIVPNTPSGKQLPALESNALFEGQERGVLVAAPLAIVAEEEGLYWFDVTVEQEVLTRIPLRLMYQKVLPQMLFPPQQGG